MFRSVANAFVSRHLVAPQKARGLAQQLAPFEQGTLEVIGSFLKIGPVQARRIYMRSLTAFTAFSLDYDQTCRAGVAYMEQRTRDIEVQNLERVNPYLQGRQPLLIVTMHMGVFPLGFLRLVSMIETGREVFVFKMSGQNANETSLFAAFQHKALALQALRPGEGGGRRAYMELRRGHMVVMAVDLEVHVTARTPVSFLGRTVMMQSGPATLATLTGATVLPVVNFHGSDGRPVLRIEEPITARPLHASELQAEIIGRVTQGIAQALESWIRIHPTQVHAWSSLAETVLRPVAPSVQAHPAQVAA